MGPLFNVRIDLLLFPRPVPQGLDVLVLMSLAYTLKGHHEWSVPPVKLGREPGGFWRIADGRHRVIAAMMVGRETVVAFEDPTLDRSR